METLLNILDQAPKNVLKNLDLIVVGPGNNENNQMTQHMIGGHPITITKERLSEVEIKRQKSFVRDYISAKEKLSDELNSVGIKPAAILPSGVFYNVLSECNLIRFEELGENGEQEFDFHQLHFPFALPLFWLSLERQVYIRDDSKLGPALVTAGKLKVNYQNNFNSCLPPLDPARSGLTFSEDDFAIFFPKDGDIEPSEIGFAYYLSMPGAISSIENFEKNEPLKGRIPDFGKLKNDNDLWQFFFWDGFKNSKEENPKKTNAQIKVTFPEVPKDLQEMLLHVHEMLPHWKLFTAAAPGAFKITNKRGFNMLDYIKLGVIPTWKKVYERVNEKYSFLKSTNTLDEYLVSHQKDDDPIFYYIVKNTFNSVEYSHAVVFGQYGDFPDEKKAFEVSKVYSKAYEGSFQN
jgi:hypothetical protein